MHPEMILIACAVLAVFLIPSLITVRPRYTDDDDADQFASPGADSHPVTRS